MKKLRKILAGLLAVAMVAGLSTAAFASEVVPPPTQGHTDIPTDTLTDTSTDTITKTYTATNEGTTSPAEEFHFTIERTSVTDAADGVTNANMPIPTISNVTYTEGEATEVKDITITLPAYSSVGIYTYTLKETAGTTAGVTYDTTAAMLVVTVINGENGGFIRLANVHVGEDKTTNVFHNTYSAGTLDITKTVTGNMGDKNKYFTFTVMLEVQDGMTYADSYVVTGGSNEENPASIKIGEATQLYLKDGDTISIANLPYGVTYTVTEDEVDDYTTGKTGDTGTINAAQQTAAFTNDKTGEIDMGVVTDSLPYVLLLVGALAMGVMMVVSKRRNVE